MRVASKLPKRGAKMTPKKFFSPAKNAQFDAEFNSVEKSIKSFQQKSH
jgi:hypothetical protein